MPRQARRLAESDGPGPYKLARQREFLRCPWHGWEFDIRTGQSWCDPIDPRAADMRSGRVRARDLVKGPYVAETFQVSVEEDYVLIYFCDSSVILRRSRQRASKGDRPQASGSSRPSPFEVRRYAPHTSGCGATSKWLKHKGDNHESHESIGAADAARARHPFTGTVCRIPLRGAGAARVGAASVTFEPGARTAWHTHPLGQTLIVTAGCAGAPTEGGPVEEIRPGDVVWFRRREALARRRPTTR